MTMIELKGRQVEALIKKIKFFTNNMMRENFLSFAEKTKFATKAQRHEV
jgi:hypothetical protein